MLLIYFKVRIRKFEYIRRMCSILIRFLLGKYYQRSQLFYLKGLQNFTLSFYFQVFVFLIIGILINIFKFLITKITICVPNVGIKLGMEKIKNKKILLRFELKTFIKFYIKELVLCRKQKFSWPFLLSTFQCKPIQPLYVR